MTAPRLHEPGYLLIGELPISVNERAAIVMAREHQAVEEGRAPGPCFDRRDV